MNNMVLIKKELRENKWVFFIGLLILMVMALVSSLSFNVVKSILESSDTSKIPAIPPEYIDSLKNFGDYTWTSWFGKSYTQAMAVLAIILGMGTIAGEISKDTISFLLSKPFSRSQVFAQKYLAGISLLVILGIGSSKLQYFIAWLTGNKLNIGFGKFLLGAINSIPSILIIYSIAVILSVIFNDRLKAGLTTAVLAIALTVPSFFPDYREYNFYKYILGQDLIKGMGFPWQSFIILSLITVFLYIIGNQLFKRKQF